MEKIPLSYAKFQETTKLVLRTFRGEINSAEFETRKKVIEQIFPLLEHFAGGAVSARNHLESLREGNPEQIDIDKLISADEIFFYFQGVVSAFLFLGESILELANSAPEGTEKEKPKKRKTRPKE